MEPRTMLLAQLDVLRGELINAGKAIVSPQLDPELRERVGPRFELGIQRRRDQVEALRTEVKDDQPLVACWERFHQVEGACRELFDECLAFVQGALARTANVDNGLCLMADQLLADLSAVADIGWNRFTLLDTGEYFEGTAAIIRVRFPENSLWSLPVAAHEFGHFLGPELRRQTAGGDFTYPFQEMLRTADQQKPANWPLAHSRDWHYLHEHFADIFATYSLGPAYAASFLLLRLNPALAYPTPPSLTHPSAAERAHGVLWALEQMNATASPDQPYRPVITRLGDTWRAGLASTGQPESLDPAAAALLEGHLTELWTMLTTHTPPGTAYPPAGWLRALALSNRLDPEDETGLGPELNEAISRRDVLNAAWHRRLMGSVSARYLLAEMGQRTERAYRMVGDS